MAYQWILSLSLHFTSHCTTFNNYFTVNSFACPIGFISFLAIDFVQLKEFISSNAFHKIILIDKKEIISPKHLFKISYKFWHFFWLIYFSTLVKVGGFCPLPPAV